MNYNISDLYNVKRKIILFTVMYISFGIGANIYTDLRGFSHGLFRWVDSVFPMNLQVFSNSWIDNSFILYNLPDGLWMLSFCLLLILIWQNTSKSSAYTWLIIGFAMGILYEVSQYFGVVSGTFDIIDVVCILVAFLLSSITIFTLNKQP